jgi:hypothetical protein
LANELCGIPATPCPLGPEFTAEKFVNSADVTADAVVRGEGQTDAAGHVTVFDYDTVIVKVLLFYQFCIIRPFTRELL